MPDLASARTISASIDRAPEDVYDFIVEPSNLPQWVKSFAVSVREEAGRWEVSTPDGQTASILFVERNPYLVADHEVHIGGLTVPNLLRVVPNRGGAEVLFTLLQEEGQDDAAFDELAGVVERDLLLLKGVLEA